MKIIWTAIVAHFVILGCSLGASTIDVNALEERIRAEFRDFEWLVVKDFKSITLIRTNVQFMGTINAPFLRSAAELENRWSKAPTNDFRLTITCDTKLSQEEYDELLRTKNRLIEKRRAIAKPQGKDILGLDLVGFLRLPQYYTPRSSVYLYSSDGFGDGPGLATRPVKVEADRAKLVAIVEKFCSKYSIAAAMEQPVKPLNKAVETHR